MSKFRVNSLSIVYHCAKHNLPTLILAMDADGRECGTESRVQ